MSVFFVHLSMRLFFCPCMLISGQALHTLYIKGFNFDFVRFCPFVHIFSIGLRIPFLGNWVTKRQYHPYNPLNPQCYPFFLAGKKWVTDFFFKKPYSP